ncbi:MAG: DNA methyltransferase [Saprospiraceae bacterium]
MGQHFTRNLYSYPVPGRDEPQGTAETLVHYTSEEHPEGNKALCFWMTCTASLKKQRQQKPPEQLQRIIFWTRPGCGNFFVISYRELRELEILILRRTKQNRPGLFWMSGKLSGGCGPDAGIEIDEFAVRIASSDVVN